MIKNVITVEQLLARPLWMLTGEEFTFCCDCPQNVGYKQQELESLVYMTSCDYPHDKGYKQLHIRLGIVNTRVLISVLLTLTLKGIKLKILRSLSYFHNSCARC